MRILHRLARPSVILLSLISMMIIGASFAYFQRFVGGELLDLSMNGPSALQRLGEMSESQRRAHSWLTLIPDSLYPIAYGSFFAGATFKLFGNTKAWLILPVLATVIADFGENTVQVLALNGHENLILAKSVLTPAKFSMFILMSIVFIVSAAIALIRYFKKKSNSSGLT